jgi:hypothetical protein
MQFSKGNEAAAAIRDESPPGSATGSEIVTVDAAQSPASPDVSGLGNLTPHFIVATTSGRPP